MRSFKLLERRARYILAAIGLVSLGVVAPFASAATVTSRSIQLGNASAGADNVSYQINFTSVGAAGAFVVDFCTNSPLLNQSCTAPDAGFSVVGAASTTSGFTDVEALASDTDANTFRVVGTIGAASAVSVDVTGINNPDTAGTLYARIVTFANATDAEGYTSADADAVGAHIDDGGVALSITPTIGVSGYVLETLTFCVSGADTITAGCASGVTAPTVKLGNVVGDNTVIDAADTYEGSIYTQISTNASSGAIVRLKSNTTGCGGLARVGAASYAAGCGIAPALAAGINDGEAKFGVKTGTAAGQSPSTGTYRAFDGGSGAYYDDTTFKLNWVNGDASGITSTYGDPFLDTNGAPVQNMEMPITFGASASANTPAGRYEANLSLIATGTF